MNKILKRLLSVVLAVVMVIGLVPLSGVTTVEAASDNNTAGMTIYLDASIVLSNNNQWDSGSDIKATISYNDNSQSTVTLSSVQGKAHWYSLSLEKNAWQIKFFRDLNKNDSFTLRLDEREADEDNVARVTGWTSGLWTGETYTPSGTGGDIPTDGIFYVDTDLVDYFNDARVDEGDTATFSTNNQGSWMGNFTEHKGTAFSYLNGKISQYLGYNHSEDIPLYFGSLLFVNNRVGREYLNSPEYKSLATWNTTANVALTKSNQNDNNVNTAEHNTSAAVQGLVYNQLGSDGKLLAPDKQTELPYFSKTLADANDWKYSDHSLMKYYEGYQFPFKVSTYENSDVKKYSYDSETDYAVRLSENTNEKKLVAVDTQHKTMNTDGTSGYYPFNTVGETNRDHVNYGFGTKFTIPFTVNENGTIDGTENGDPITFSFTGDDDVWVFIDGHLVLDMGGAHAKAEGTIDFKKLTATVKNAAKAENNNLQVISGNSNEISNYQKKGLANYVWEDGAATQERSTVATSDSVKTFAQLVDDDFAKSFKDSSQTHTLVMFYMERGMYDSNMKVEFTINPLPSGLSLSKSLDVTDVNDGLASAVQEAEDDSFSFKIQTKDSESEGAFENVENLGYTLTKGNKDSELQTAQNSIISGVGAKSYAHSFINTTSEDNAFTSGTSFEITELTENTGTVFEYDYNNTTWTVYDKNANNNVIASSAHSGMNNLVAKFDFPDTSDFIKYDYGVNFTNKPKVGSVSVTKQWKNGETAPKDGKYSFQILVDLDGEENDDYNYLPYELDYTLNGDTKSTDADGKFTLKIGDTVTFAGIPVGASYKIVESIPENANYTSDQKDNTVTGTINNSAANVTFINGFNTKELDKVIYIEAGREDGTNYTVIDSDNAKITIADISPAEGITVGKNSDGTVNFKSDNADMKYEVSYSGTKTDGTIVTGTITVFTYKATNKVYVFDYGLESDLTETNGNHDGLFQDGVFYNDNAKNSDYATSATLGEVKGAEGNSQTRITPAKDVKINDDGSAEGAVTFKPVAFMDKAENYTYKANIVKNGATFSDSDPETGTVVNGTIEVMPANVVYYEDNFNSDAESTDSAVKIIYSGTSAPTGTSLELTQSNGQTEQYGHDDAYASGTTDSAGSSTALTADGYNTKAEFTFTGSGFDVVARTTTETAGIIYMIQKYDADGKTWSDVKFGAVDTYYANGDLYQIPVIHEDLGETAKYKVTLTIRETENKSSVVYLDGIRIYNPMGASGNTDYIENEKNVTFEKVSDLILGNGTITETGVVDEYGSEITGQTIEGSRAALMDNSNIEDGKVAVLGYTRTEDSNADAAGSNQTNSILQYLHSGPNNEIYLDEYASIALVAEGASSDSSTLQIEAKLVNIDGQSGDAPVSDGVDLNVWNGTELVKQDTVTSSTAMYYTIDLNDCINLGNNSYLVVISGNSDAGSKHPGTSCLSFSNLKYKGYTLSNPLDEEYSNAVEKYIDTSNLNDENKFVDFTGTYKIRKNQWVNYKYTVTLTDDVFNGEDPEFTMYYTNNGKKTEITVTAERVKEFSNKYNLRFRAPNAVGNFPIEIHYIDDEGSESADFLATSMTVNR